MIRVSLFAVRRAIFPVGALVLLALFPLSCAKPASTGCGGFGLICPEGTRCSSDGASCISLDSRCGDGVIQQEDAELCDDGNQLGSDGCSSDCKSTEVCGNGKLDLNLQELCDDGNKVGGDGCSADCRSFGVCGDSTIDPGEICDDGNASDADDCPQCKVAQCGDGFVNTQGTKQESCDYLLDKMGCDTDCTPRLCGDSTVNGEAGEQCDPPGASTAGVCTTACTVALCGDRIISPLAGEVCDDGNNLNGDGCSNDCRSGEGCGNAIVDAGEVCDDGNANNADGCTNDCKNGCGNGNLEPGEECEPPSAGTSSATCNNDCTRSLCGDGKNNPAANEACDDGNSVTETSCNYGTQSCTQCNANCTAVLNLTGPYCGDSVRSNGEVCDDGNTTTETSCAYGTPNCAQCDAACSTALNLTGRYCGDTFVTDTEVCDDGNTTTETSCSYGTQSCTQCNAACTNRLLLTGPYCGDGIRSDGEVCDDGNITTETSCPYGTPNCTRCDAVCATVLNLTGPYCGDGLVHGSELCDDGNADACGTCNASCTQTQRSRATGYIDAVSSSDIVDGEIFTIDDGTSGPNTFEFDSNQIIQPGSVQIIIPSTPAPDGGVPASDGGVPLPVGEAGRFVATPDEMATLIVQTLQDEQRVTLNITAESASSRVLLTHRGEGAYGNQAMTERVANPSFRVVGMSGGSSRDCPSGTGCVQDQDCAYWLTCNAASRVCE